MCAHQGEAVAEELAFASAMELAELIRSREVSSTELVTMYLERIDRLNPTLRAYVTLTGDEALAQARAADEAVAATEELAPFHGVPFAIKDENSTAGIRTTYSSRAFADHVPDVDTDVVRRYREAGFISLGKTNNPEFGMLPVTESVLNGACCTPWDAGRTSGGSTGGGACAVAAGLAPVADAADGGGSIRMPASCCGVYGLKPSRGRISFAPVAGDPIEGLATFGSLTRTVRDSAALLDLLEGYVTGDPYWAPPPQRRFLDEVGTSPGRLRIGVTVEPPSGASVAPECVAAVDDVAGLLSDLGHDVLDATPDWKEERFNEWFTKIWQVGAASFGVEDTSLIEPHNRLFAERAARTSCMDFLEAVWSLHAFARRVVAAWVDLDVVLTPTLALSPIPIGWLFEDGPEATFERTLEFTPFTPLVNVTGQPAASVPLHWTDDGLPIGVHLIGRPADEATLLRLSAQLEEARPWTYRRPPLS